MTNIFHVWFSDLGSRARVGAWVLLSPKGRLLRKSALGEFIENEEYLGAAMRLTAELSRYAITQVT